MGSNEHQQAPKLAVGATACLFPRLSDCSVSVSNRAEKLEIETVDIYESLRNANIQPWVLAVAVWAAVLQCFTETECVQLWVCGNAEATTDLEQLLVIPLASGTTIRELCHTQNWSLVRVKKPGLANSNVGVALDQSISLDAIPVSTHTASEERPMICDIFLHLRRVDDHLRISLEYKETLLSHAMVKHLASTIQQGLIVANNQLDDPLGALCLVSDLNLQQMMVWSGDRHREQETPPWWHRLKELALRLTDKTAISAWDGDMSFTDLDRASSRAAYYLRNAGIGPNMFIPVCFEKSIWAIIAAIGIHKTGAAFVPLEPSQPLPRLEQIIKAVGTKLVVTSACYADLLNSVSKSLVITAESILAFSLPDTFAPTLPDMSSPAYCLFTSGSTGKPKGCVMSHRAFASIVSQVPAFHLSEDARFLQFASYSFGMSIIEIYCTLSAGGTVCIPSDEDRSSISSLVNAINQMAVSHIVTTPTVLGTMQPETVPSLRMVMTGGEPLQRSQVLTWAEKVSLYQCYGLSEWAGALCTSERITPLSNRGSIGRPTNGQIWLVDPTNHTRPAPIGSVGELLIEGPGLAQGYLNDQKKTDAAFLARPPWLTALGRHDQGHMYRTGDLMRFLPDGSLMYMGRKDTQLKIRGQRVELGEVEFHVKNCYPESIKVVVEVITPSGNKGQQVLAAFIQQPPKTVCKEEGVSWFAPSNVEFQAQGSRAEETIRSQLPRYMVPNVLFWFVQPNNGEILQAVLDGSPAWDVATSKDEYLDRPGRLDTGLGKSLLRSCIVQEAPTSGRIYLILTMHHSICDRWVLRLHLEQLEATYRGGGMIATPYNQFIRYVRDIKDDEAFWGAQFKGLTAAPFPRLPSPNFKPASNHNLELQMKVPKAVERGFTVSTAIQVAWGFVLRCYTGTDDVVFGLTLTGRAANISGIEKMAGPTIATVPMRIQLHPQTITSHVLNAQQEQIARITPYEQTGLQRMRAFGPESELACSFQNHLIIQSPWESDAESLFATRVDSEAVAGGFANSPLVVTCQLAADPEKVVVSVRFDARVIAQQEVQRLLWSLQSTLCSMLTDHSRPLRELPTISSQDLEQLIQWNPLPTYTKSSVTAMVSQSCSKFSHRPAVDAWDGQFTYGALDKLSTSLARHLIARGVKPRSYVPIYTEKSRWAVVAMLAVLKSGAAIMLLDPSQPVKRLKENCQLAQASLTIASPMKVRAALELAPDVIVSTGDYSHWTIDEMVELPPAQSDYPLYTVFTSGSTGKPKGVIIDHTTFLAAAIPNIEGIGIDQSTRWLQFCSYAFDVATVEQLWVLVSGGCVWIPRDEQRLNGIPEAAAVLRPTHTLLTPSFAYTLDPDQFPSLEVLLLGGESMQAKNIHKWAHRVRLVNSYGPAEAGSAYKNFHVKPESIPNTIGYAMGGRSWLVHPQNSDQLVPIGAVGELLMNGPYVGLGYMGDSEKTAAAFIRAPSWLDELNRSLGCCSNPEDPLCRLYKTGDLFCYNLDGSLRYVGRKDTQVKLRGQRIELGEVEWHVQDLFKDAVNVVAEVIPSVGSQISPSLVAFLHRAVDEAEIPDSYFLPSSAEFRKRCATATAELRDRIPGFMIPSLIIPVARLPQGATGKIDRKALRETVVTMSDLKRSEYRMAIGEKKRAPTTEAERKLHAIWAEVLKVPVNEIGIDDNFLHLGGDSLNAMYMAARARAEGLALAVTDILQNPKISTLATLDSKRLVDEDYASMPFSLVDVGTRESAIQEAIRLGLASHATHIADVLPVTDGQSFLLTQWTPVYQCHDIEGPVDVDMLRVACRAVIANHAILRTAFIRTGKSMLQVILKSLDRPLQHITTDENLMMYCDNLSQADCQISSTVNSAPLQFTLVSNTSTRHVFIIRISHAQYDGLSMPVLLNDIAAEYSGMRTCASVDFSSYMYFRASKTTDKAFAFWRDYLHGSSITNINLKFPTEPSSSKPRRADDRRVSAAKEIPLPTAPAGITIANLVKAACAFVLARLTAQTDLVLGQAVNGRSLPLPNIDKVLGACLNFIPLRVTLQKSRTAHELLQHVQAQSVSTLTYDYLDSSEIFKQSTDWPADTCFSCVVQHQNLERTPGLRLAGTKAAFAGWAHFIPVSGMWIISSPRESSLDVMMCTSEGVMCAETARGLVEEICAAIQSFANSPGDELDLNGGTMSK